MLDDAVRALLGGLLIGLAAAIVLVLHGRIAGISGTLGRALDDDGGRAFRLAFLGGLVTAGAIAAQLAPSAFGTPVRGLEMLAIAGLLVGLGTGVGNGCTSGHGVCGIGRGSKRSIVAVLAFMASGVVTVAIVGASS
jgi:hypothetical protein